MIWKIGQSLFFLASIVFGNDLWIQDRIDYLKDKSFEENWSLKIKYFPPAQTIYGIQREHENNLKNLKKYLDRPFRLPESDEKICEKIEFLAIILAEACRITPECQKNEKQYFLNDYLNKINEWIRNKSKKENCIYETEVIWQKILSNQYSAVWRPKYI